MIATCMGRAKELACPYDPLYFAPQSLVVLHAATAVKADPDGKVRCGLAAAGCAGA